MPERFISQASFYRNYVEGYYDNYGRSHIGGLKNPLHFKKVTEKNIIRFEREEVMPQLPKINRMFTFFDMAAEVQKAYDSSFRQFAAVANQIDLGHAKFEDYSNMMAFLSKMRHACGLSKVDPCVEFVSQFIEENDRQIVIFVHHIDVGDILELKLKQALPDIGIKRLKSDSKDRDEIIQACTRYGWYSNDPKDRILIASTLAAGEGINLQACSDAVILERQWNPANEEQAEARFTRIGSVAKCVNINYMLVIQTVDEYLSELVEKKREICRKTYGHETISWDETSLMKELMSTLLAKGAKKYRLPGN
jgi:SNF2 family DNA or RNA helicase